MLLVCLLFVLGRVHTVAKKHLNDLHQGFIQVHNIYIGHKILYNNQMVSN